MRRQETRLFRKAPWHASEAAEGLRAMDVHERHACKRNTPNASLPPRTQKGDVMHIPYRFALLTLALALCGCSGNYTWSDDQYRPLGEPQAAPRGK